MLGTPAVFLPEASGLEFAVHARQHLAIDIWLRITFGVVFAPSLVLGSGHVCEDSAASFHARLSLAGDGRRQVVGGPRKFLQLIQKPNNSPSDLNFRIRVRMLGPTGTKAVWLRIEPKGRLIWRPIGVHEACSQLRRLSKGMMRPVRGGFSAEFVE